MKPERLFALFAAAAGGFCFRVMVEGLYYHEPDVVIAGAGFASIAAGAALAFTFEDES